MLRYARVFIGLTAALAVSFSQALADPPSLGLNVNLINGTFQGSQRQNSSLPTTPIPAVTLSVPIGAFRIRAEEVPPIGPVQYANGFGGTQATKLSYLNAALMWHTKNDRFEIGAGTSLLNQITYYTGSSVAEQSSRVAGFRYSGRIRIENGARAVTDLTVAASPSMHGLQNSKILAQVLCPPIITCSNTFNVRDSEQASLMDITAQRTQTRGGFQFLYGLRYVNYVAHFDNGRPADHDSVVMPFLGVAFSIGH